MSVLLMRLTGPMQSWGVQSRFSTRDTAREPTKSGVVGLLCAACGIDRDDERRIAEIAQLEMAVRVDREGTVARDFHTAGGGTINGAKYGVVKAGGSSGDTVVSHRYYLADADFLVGLQGPDPALIQQLDSALGNPVWPLFLGRKSFPPGLPVRAGLREGELNDVIRTEPWVPRHERDEVPLRGLRIVADSHEPTGPAAYDHPICFSKDDRRFALRHVATTWIASSDVTRGDLPCTSHA